jgi:putative ABC transport system permease protein
MKKFQKLVGHGFRSMGRHRLRTFFMMLGTFVGVAALTVVVALGQGTRQEVMSRIDRMFSGSSILLSSGAMGMGGGPRDAPSNTLTLEDLAALESSVDGILTWDPMQMAGAREVIWNGNSSEVRIMGHSERAEVVWTRGVSRGSFLAESDVASSALVALVGETLATEVFGDTDPIGEQIRIGTVPFDVVGVLEVQGIDPHGWDRDNEVHIPITTMMRRLLNVDYIMSSKIIVAEGVDLEPMVGEIENTLRERHALADAEPNDFAMITPVQVEEMVDSANRVFTVFLPLVALVSILVGGIVVANLMLMSVNERRSEIGLRKAVGARSRDIWLQFLVESSLVTVIGGVVALLACAVLLRFVGQMMGTPSLMPWQAAIAGLLAALAVGIVAGVAPARRASKLDPVHTLR